VVSVALVSTQPIFAALLGRALGDRAGAGVYVGGAVAIVGSTLMVGSAAAATHPSSVTGAALALAGAVTAAIYLLVGRGLRETLPLHGYFGLVNCVAGAFLGLGVTLSGVPIAPAGATASDYLAVIYLGLVPGVLGHGLINWAVRRVPVHIVSLATVLEPVGATALAWLVLREAPSVREALGGAVLLVGVSFGLKRRA
jgi:drug/metabolite transporter (DMT)-like permease